MQPDYKISSSRPIKYFTILRHPVSRIYSHYWYDLTESVNPKRIAMMKGWDFRTWFNAPRFPHDPCKFPCVCRPFSSHQKKGVLTPSPLFARTGSSDNNPNIQQLCCWTYYNFVKPKPPNTCPPSEETLECAKKNLRELTMVGLSESLPASLRLLNHKLGITLPSVEHANAFKKQRPSISLRDRKLVLERNKFDAELYQFAKRLFRKQYEEAFGEDPGLTGEKNAGQGGRSRVLG